VNPFAPIGHHWIDSTHVTFGLVTAGVFTTRYKVEGSLFNGREPDERRSDVDLGPLDSYSGRFTFAPGPRVTLQVSAAHLREAEAQFAPQPRTDSDRVSASATFVTRRGRNSWFGRLELTGKPGHDLHEHTNPARILPTTKLQGGYVRDLGVPGVFTLGAGGTAAVSIIPTELTARYGGRFAPSAGVFLVVRPRHRM
jgi:hypothetical protein